MLIPTYYEHTAAVQKTVPIVVACQQTTPSDHFIFARGCMQPCDTKRNKTTFWRFLAPYLSCVPEMEREREIFRPDENCCAPETSPAERGRAHVDCELQLQLAGHAEARSFVTFNNRRMRHPKDLQNSSPSSQNISRVQNILFAAKPISLNHHFGWQSCYLVTKQPTHSTRM